MVILVDDATWPWRGRLWAHLVSDTAFAELHAFAAALGIPPRGFQGDHYDVPTEVRERALALGAEAVSSRELVRRLTVSGLRRRRPHWDPHQDHDGDRNGTAPAGQPP